MHLSSITVFPIKSLTGISVYSWPLEKRGLKHDRRWMITDKAGKFITQREHPEMALLGTEIIGNRIFIFDKKNPKDCVYIRLEITEGETIRAEIWNFEGTGLIANENANQWISKKLGTECCLVYMPEETVRAVNPEYGKPGDITNFSDGYPVLACNQSSLEDLNSKLEDPITMDRFRPNLVFSGFDAWDEDKWKNISVGTIPFRVVKPCERCVITTNDPETGITGKEPLKTLSTFRKIDNKVLFGQNLIPDDEGMIVVGDKCVAQ